MIDWFESGRQWAYEDDWEAETDKGNWRERVDMAPFPKEEDAGKAGAAPLAAWRAGYAYGENEMKGS